jgi:hypothetical protein
VRFRTFFPFLYYVHPVFGRRFVDAFDADVVLLGLPNRARLERFGPSGEAMLRLLAARYREAGRFTTSLGETVVLVAGEGQANAASGPARLDRAPHGVRPAATRSGAGDGLDFRGDPGLQPGGAPAGGRATLAFGAGSRSRRGAS